MKLFYLTLILGSLAFMTSCSMPSYERTVTRSYNETGKLTGTTVTEHVKQRDPFQRPLLDVLEKQTYKK